MKTKYFFIAAIAGMTLAGCSSDDFIAETPPTNVADEGMAPIVFSSEKSNFTRGENDFKGKEAADLLGGQFVVFGYKGSKTVTPGSTVFDNYLVEYTENSANTTESNSSNWEYVGKTPIHWATEHGITKQTIKYWDYSQSQYDFIAWSTGSKTAIYEKPSTGIPAGEVFVSEITAQAATDPATGLVTAYTFEGEVNDLKDCYIADLVTVYKDAKGSGVTDPTYNVVYKGYQQPVTLKFRQLGTKVRIGIYETVPGYSVKDVKFYSEAANALLDEATTGNKEKNESAKIFTTVANGIYKEGKYTVSFPTVDDPTNADNNQAHIEFTPKENVPQNTTVDWGGLNYTYRESGESSEEPIYLGRASNTASFAGDADNNYYVVYLPNQDGTNLNLRVNYTLESIDGSKETIVVKGATAQVPSIYTAWKPGYAYTYLFKISDKTNGHTGKYNPLYPDDITVNSDPAGLYPITFDAVVVNAEEDATQETITTVSAPSITTYQKGSEVVNKNEYDHATGPIFVTVNDGENSYEKVTGLTAGTSSVAGYYTKGTQDVYTLASGTAESGKEYYTYNSGTNSYSVAASQPTVGDDISASDPRYYTKSTVDVYTQASGTAVANTEYYRMVTTAESGKVVTLVKTDDAISVNNQANLFTLPTGKAYTEADVVDALQLQDDDATSGTIKGRSGLVLTPATFDLVTSIEYGVDGNAISLTGLPKQDGTGTYDANAIKFTAAAGSYAFVYTKKAKTGTDINKYQAKTVTEGASVNGLYRYKLVAATANQDVEKGVTYFTKENPTAASEGAITAFLGQDVSNLYLDNTGTKASGIAKTGTNYWYTDDNGLTFKAVAPILYANFKGATDLYTFDGSTYSLKTDDSPVPGTAYYKKTTAGSAETYTYCVIYPQRTSWEESETTKYLYVFKGTDTTVDANFVKCGENDKAVKGMTYFDMYSQNNGVYYVKVIKVQ